MGVLVLQKIYPLEVGYGSQGERLPYLVKNLNLFEIETPSGNTDQMEFIVDHALADERERYPRGATVSGEVALFAVEENMPFLKALILLEKEGAAAHADLRTLLKFASRERGYPDIPCVFALANPYPYPRDIPGEKKHYSGMGLERKHKTLLWRSATMELIGGEDQILVWMRKIVR